ncbi:hypothetical protein LIA77_12028 [Sarocladium implicatum]|nr:hypothetical protein LIA77_12028 [Sarocladium implicatum]
MEMMRRNGQIRLSRTPGEPPLSHRKFSSRSQNRRSKHHVVILEGLRLSRECIIAGCSDYRRSPLAHENVLRRHGLRQEVPASRSPWSVVGASKGRMLPSKTHPQQSMSYTPRSTSLWF